MNRLQPFILSISSQLLVSIASVLTVVQIILAFFMHGPDSAPWELAGWSLLWIAGVFGTLPILIFRRKGKVPKGESYIKTTVLVDSGLYAIVRHPQNGTAWLLINLGVILVARHWTSLVLGLVSMFLAYPDTYHEDRRCLEKLGEAYRHYMERVPRVNPIVGIIRLALQRNRA
jgi:protein-S-isoprenylcysteine O-methyltransferase Ste14